MKLLIALALIAYVACECPFICAIAVCGGCWVIVGCRVLLFYGTARRCSVTPQGLLSCNGCSCPPPPSHARLSGGGYVCGTGLAGGIVPYIEPSYIDGAV